MSSSSVDPAAAPQHSLLARLVAQGVAAAVGLAVGAVAGVVAALWLGLIDIVC